MSKVNPYKTAKGLISALDNGGRWYHLLSRADDGVIDDSELNTAAEGGDPFLFVALASWKLDPFARQDVARAVGGELGRWLMSDGHRTTSCAEAVEQPLSSRVLLEGVIDAPRDVSLTYIQLHTAFSRTHNPDEPGVLDPDYATVGQRYDLWTVRDSSGEALLLFKRPRRMSLPSGRVVVGGVVAELGQTVSGDALRHIAPHHIVALDPQRDDDDGDDPSRAMLRTALGRTPDRATSDD